MQFVENAFDVILVFNNMLIHYQMEHLVQLMTSTYSMSVIATFVLTKRSCMPCFTSIRLLALVRHGLNATDYVDENPKEAVFEHFKKLINHQAFL